MDNKERLGKAVDYAIESNYEIHNRAIDVYKSVYQHKNICIFGTGEFFEDCAIPEHLRRFEYVGDNDPTKWGKEFKGRRCLSPEEITKMDDIVVLIMVGEWRPIYKQLTDMGIECYPMDWYSMNVYDPHYSPDWFAQRKQTIIDAINLFEDDISKEIYVEAVCNRIAPHLATKIFNEIKTPGEYFNSDVFKMSSNECMVDAGAYKGDSIEKFLNVTGGKFEKIYSFELDNTIFQELRRTVEKYDIEKIELYNAGVSDKDEEIEYAYVAGEERNLEKVVALDHVLADKRVTFIKMDVETFEIKALHGAETIIKINEPKLCISAYHYLSDLWEVPLTIKEINPKYRLYLRHHSPAVWDTDCYAMV